MYRLRLTAEAREWSEGNEVTLPKTFASLGAIVDWFTSFADDIDAISIERMRPTSNMPRAKTGEIVATLHYEFDGNPFTIGDIVYVSDIVV